MAAGVAPIMAPTLGVWIGGMGGWRALSGRCRTSPMTATMLVCATGALLVYLLVVRPAEARAVALAG